MRPVLITCGGTRNPVDAIRYLSAGATGTTGIAIARRLREAGRDVHVLGSLEAALRAPDLAVEVYGSTRDLLARVQRWCTANPDGVVVHSAAVGDYEAATDAGKIPSGQAELVLRLTPTPKIVDQIHTWAPNTWLVSFKAGRPEIPADELEAIARAQARRTGSKVVFANALDHTATDVMLVGPDETARYANREDALEALIASLP